jgi:hypothetical protein
VAVNGLEEFQTSAAVVADDLEEAAQAPTAAALARAKLAVSGRVIVVAARLVSSGSPASDGSLLNGACSREPFHARLLRERLGFWRLLRRLFGCCCGESGCRFRC